MKKVFSSKKMQSLYDEAKRVAPQNTSLYLALIWQPIKIELGIQNNPYTMPRDFITERSVHNKDTWFMLSQLEPLRPYWVWFTPDSIVTRRMDTGAVTTNKLANPSISGGWTEDWKKDTAEELQAKEKYRSKNIRLIRTNDIYPMTSFQAQLPKGNYLDKGNCLRNLCTYDSTEQKLTCTCGKSGIVSFVKAELKPVKLTDTVNYDRNTGKLSKVQNS